VLSGGAARAYAHIGAIRALRESGTPIDFVGGVSMGAVIGAGVAMGWDDAELDQRIRQAFVANNPVNDIALPLVAITRGEKVRQRLQQHFLDRTICDLWLPFFCISTNLTTGLQQIHRQGLLRDVLRASLSVPGVLPPVTVGDDVLVDGAILNNFPADIMRTLNTGPIVGIDVAQDRSIEATDVRGWPSLLRWLISGAWRDGAPIVSILMRAATVTAYRQAAAAHEMTDLLIQPKLDAIEIRDWKAYEPAVAEGYRAALAALALVEGSVSNLRHAPSGAE
jgi:NTE family protein